MARKPRIHLSGGVYHVMLRGNGGQRLFFSDADYQHLYGLLEEGVGRYGYRVHGFCCMSNHIHLALQVGDIPLARGMQNLAFRYTRWINRRQKRIGHLFQGRYKAILVDRDAYLIELVRYIHLNPVRAGLVKDPAVYRWSGHRAYIGQDALSWMMTDWVLGQFGRRAGEARSRYARFVQEGLGEGHREEFHKGGEDTRILGDDDFLDRIHSKSRLGRAKVPSIEIVIQTVGREYGVEEVELRTATQRRKLSEARAMVGWLTLTLECGTLTDAGHRVNRDVGTMSSAVQRLVDRSGREPALKQRMERLKSSLR
jgi:REP element-mobilizing transposase RayT